MSISIRSTTRLAVVMLVACGCAHPSNRSATMSDPVRDENKRKVETLFDNCFNQGDLGLLDQLVAPDYVGPQGSKGPGGFRGIVVGLRTGFPDIHYTVDDVIAEGDRVAVRWHWTGTNKGPFRTFAPTGKTFTNPGVGIFQFKDGKIVAAALETDRLGFLEQMGVVPPGVGLGGRPAPAAAGH
jgi:predicted ester cyclase